MTPALRYSPGRQYLVAGPVGGALVSVRHLAERVWPLVRDSAPMTDILAELLMDGLASLPELVLYEFDGTGMRVILRGDVSVTVESADGSAETCTGLARRTWMEHVFLRAVSGTVGETTDAGLPLQTGVALVGGFAFALDGAHDEKAAFADPFYKPIGGDLLSSRRPRPAGSATPKVVSLFPQSADPARLCGGDAGSTPSASE